MSSSLCIIQYYTILHTFYILILMGNASLEWPIDYGHSEIHSLVDGLRASSSFLISKRKEEEEKRKEIISLSSSKIDELITAWILIVQAEKKFREPFASVRWSLKHACASIFGANDKKASDPRKRKILR